MSWIGGFSQEKTRSKKMKQIRLFAYSVFLAVKDSVREDDLLVVDREYEGNEDAIRDLLLHLFERVSKIKLQPNQIQAGNVGKASPAHVVAIQTLRREREPEKELQPEDYFELLDRTEQRRKKAFRRRTKRAAGF